MSDDMRISVWSSDVCSSDLLFTLGQCTTSPFSVATVSDKYVNIASQKNRGIDVEAILRHDLGSLGQLSLTAGMTWQLDDDFQLLPTSPTTSDNGEAGSPKWVGDFRATWAHGSGDRKSTRLNSSH